MEKWSPPTTRSTRSRHERRTLHRIVDDWRHDCWRLFELGGACEKGKGRTAAAAVAGAVCGCQPKPAADRHCVSQLPRHARAHAHQSALQRQEAAFELARADTAV